MYCLATLKFYLPMLIAFANLLTQVGDKKFFKNLYMLKPDNFVAFLSSSFISASFLYLSFSEINPGTTPSLFVSG